MPEVVFDVTWPDGESERCYSPSTVVHEHVQAGRSYGIADFRDRARAALRAAAERVRAKYGYYCSSAADQLLALEARSARFGPHRVVRVESVLPKATAPSLERVLAAAARRARGRQQELRLAGRYPVVIVGGGQAGLAVSFHLKHAGVRHLVLERHSPGYAWRCQRWDSFCLVTPNWQCRLPGFPYRGDDPDGFMGREAVVEYVEGFAASFDPPLRCGIEVLRVGAASDGRGFQLEVLELQEGAGAPARTLHADQVVIASGAYDKPRLPAFAADLPPEIEQLHSSAYRNPERLPAGAVLVVGSGQSGCQIAEDLYLAGRRVYLSVGSAPRSPRRYRGRDVVAWLEDMGHYDAPLTDHDDPVAVRKKTNHYLTGRDGGREIDLRARARDGMRLLGRLERIDSSGRASVCGDLAARLDEADASYLRIRASIDAFIAERGIAAPPAEPYAPCWQPPAQPLRQLDLVREGVSCIVWSSGFDQSFSLVEADVFDATRYPAHVRGVTRQPGLYFVGLPWLHSWGSGRFSHVDRDARYLAAAISQHAGEQPAVSALAR